MTVRAAVPRAIETGFARGAFQPLGGEGMGER
jgi:hypothetical protein